MAESNTLTLTIKERLMVAYLFPEKGSLMSQILAKDISEKVRIGQEERDEIEFNDDEQGRLRWDAGKAKEKPIELTGAEVSFLQRQVTRLDKDQQVTAEMVDLALKIQKL